ncbi:MAG: aminopeptidase N [Patiriisocius sp.]|jgi:aminopeptidase N
MRKNIVLLIVLLTHTLFGLAQVYTEADSLRGSITEERIWWDLNYYHLDIEVLPEKRYIQGSNTIRYKVLEANDRMQIDLQSPLRITKIVQKGKELQFESKGNAHIIQLQQSQNIGDYNELIVHYEGQPKEAIRAPWDGGFSWKKDTNGDHFIATSCQGLGASVWWPCKDHMYDEVDSMMMSIEVPNHLSDISNGHLLSIEIDKKKKTKTFNWFVSNPINNYGVNVNIGNYANWNEIYEGEKGNLDVNYWALKQDQSKAKKQFKEVPRMLEAFEHWFGPYPFYEDGYKLVQVPYLGMEHQSSVTYGNEFENGYLGRDLSGTGWGLKFDFIIVHESGHEWFANNVTHKDIADMWIHESFTNYSESLFVEYFFGKEAGQEYVRGTRLAIENRKPMIGNYHVNDESYPGDVYNKGGNMLNTLRTIVDNDDIWRGLLRSINERFYHSTVDSHQLEQYISEYLKIDLSPFFDQYLRTSNLPILEYYVSNGKLHYRWTSAVPDFNMPVDIFIANRKERIYPTIKWAYQVVEKEMVGVDANFYIGTMISR